MACGFPSVFGQLLALAVLLAPETPGRVHAQERPGCEAGDCRSISDDLADSVARIQQARTDFVLSLRRLLESLPGTHGDEGPQLRSAIASMSEALGRWDRAIRAYQAPLASATGNPDVHVALGTVHFDRGRPQQAAAEWSVASRLAPERLDVFLLLGLAHDTSGRHADAARAFEKAAALAPSNAAALYGLARQRQRLGQDTGAVDVLRAFHERVTPPAPSASRRQPPFLRGGLLRETAGVAPIFPPALYSAGFDALGRGDYAAAVVAFERAAAQDPLAAARSGALAAGTAALRGGELRVALERLEEAVAAAPDVTEGRRLLAVALEADGRPAEAIEHLQAAIGRDPRDERSRLALGRALSAAGRPLDAERALRETLEALPASAQAHAELGRLYQSLERRHEAAAAFEAAAARGPIVGGERLYELIGRLRLTEADFDGAIAAFRRRVDASPNHAEAHRTLGDTYLQLGRDDEAQAEFAAAVLIDPADAHAHAARAQVHLRHERYEQAASAARAALEREPDHLGALYALGTSLLRLGQATQGAAAIDRFHALQTTARARDERAWELKLLRQNAFMHAERGEFDEAVKALRDALALEDSAEAYLSLGVVLKRAGRHGDAVAALEHAAALGAGPDVHVHLSEVYAAAGRAADSQRQMALYARAKDERFRAGAAR